MRVRLVLGTSLVAVVLAAVAVAGAPSAPKVAAATAIRLPAEPEGADTWIGGRVELCWELTGGDVPVRLFSGPSDEPMSAWSPVVSVPRGQRCWRGTWDRERAWAVAPVLGEGEGDRVLARSSLLRGQGQLPVEARLEGDHVVSIAEGGAHLWFATAGGGLTAAPNAGLGRDEVAPWTTWRRGDGLGSDRLSAVIVDGVERVWVGSEGAIARLSLSGRTWRVYGQAEGVPRGTLGPFLRDNQNRLLVGAEGGAIYAYESMAERWVLVAERPGADEQDRLLGQDADGRLWVSTSEGLRTFDLTRDPQAGWSEPQRPERATTLLSPRSGEVWFGTADGGLLHLEGARWSVALPSGEGPPAPVRALLSHDDAVLVGTDRGLLRYLPASATWGAHPDGRGAAWLDGLSVVALHEDAEGGIWAAVAHEGLRRLSPQGTVWTTRPAGVLRHGPLNAVTSTTGQVWFASDGGLSRLTLGTGAWSWWRALGGGLDPGATALAVDATDRSLWAGARGGIARYLEALERWAPVRLPDDDAKVLALLPEGPTVWVGTDRGMFRLDMATGQWEEPLRGGRLSGERIQALMRGSTGALWIGTPSGALCWTTAGGLELSPADGALAGEDILAIEEDGGGAVWFSTRDGEALQYLPASGELRRQRSPDAGPILGMARDYGRIWFATHDGLLSKAWGGREVPLERRLTVSSARGVAVDTGGRIWMATERGAVRLDPETGVERLYPAAVLEPEADARVLSAVAAGSNRVWLGTAGGVVLLVDEQGEELLRLDGRDGMPVAEIRALLRDDQGRLWIGSQGGGVVLVDHPEDPKSRSFVRLGGGSGAGSERVRALLAGERGEVCAVTDAGPRCIDAGQGWRELKVPAGLPGQVLSLYWGRDDRLWVGSDGGAGSTRRPVVSGRASGQALAGAKSLGLAGVNVFWGDPAGGTWLGLVRGGLAYLAPNATEPETVDLGEGLEDLDVRAIVQTGGRVWMATDQGAFWRPSDDLDAPFTAENLLQQEVRPAGSPAEGPWTWEPAVDLGPGTRDVYAIAATDGAGLWFATAGGAVRLDVESGVARLVDPSAPRLRQVPLLQGETVGRPLLGAAAITVGSQLIGEPSNPAAVIATAGGCGERDLLLESGDILRFVGEAGSHEVVHAPLRRPRALAVICDEGSFSRASILCVGGERLQCRALAGQWAELEIPLDGDSGAAQVTALLAGLGGALWVGYEDGQVCRGTVTLAAGGAESICWREGLPGGRVNALAEDGAGGVWVGAARGLGHVQLDEQGLAPVQVPRPLRTQAEGELQASMALDLSGAEVNSLSFDHAAATLWAAMPGRGVVRIGPPARRSFLRKAVSPVERIELAPLLGRAEALGSLAIDGDHRLWVTQGARIYDLDGRPLPASTLWMALVAVGAGAATFLLVWGSIHLSPAVRGWRRDPASVERITLGELAPALRVLRLYAPGFARASIGVARLGALERLARAWGGSAERVLGPSAEVLGLDPAGSVQGATLPVHLSVGLALKRRDTLLVLLPQEGDPEQLLRDALEARGFHELVPALAIWPGEDPPLLHGAITLTEADLRMVGWSRQPRRHLASLIWQRSDMQGLSPYQAHGAVQDSRMFFGRDAVLRELTATGKRRALLVIGPRRVGKTSVLLRAAAELERRGAKTVYVALRATVSGPYDLAVALARAAKLPIPDPPPVETPDAEAACLGAWIRANLSGANLLMDEADAFLRNDRARGSPASEELRALLQEGVCALALAGYGTLYRAALSQAETAYNLGEPLFLGSLEREAALRLATEPMERVGISWADPTLAEQLVTALGGLPHLIQEACRRLLLRVRGFREPVLNSADLYAVLGDWRPEAEPSSMRELLVTNVETNLKGPAQAAVWLLADELSTGFSLSELGDALLGAGFIEMDAERVIEVGLALQVAGVCQRGADQFRFLVPLLGEAVSHLDVGYRVSGLRDAWRALDAGARRSWKFWGGTEGEA